VTHHSEDQCTGSPRRKPVIGGRLFLAILIFIVVVVVARTFGVDLSAVATLVTLLVTLLTLVPARISFP
jgi:hypothetical protein